MKRFETYVDAVFDVGSARVSLKNSSATRRLHWFLRILFGQTWLLSSVLVLFVLAWRVEPLRGECIGYFEPVSGTAWPYPLRRRSVDDWLGQAASCIFGGTLGSSEHGFYGFPRRRQHRRPSMVPKMFFRLYCPNDGCLDVLLLADDLTPLVRVLEFTEAL